MGCLFALEFGSVWRFPRFLPRRASHLTTRLQNRFSGKHDFIVVVFFFLVTRHMHNIREMVH